MTRLSLAMLGALLAALLTVSLLAAQSSAPLLDTFDSSADGWAPALHSQIDGTYSAYASITWLTSKDIFYPIPPSLTSAQGVIRVDVTDYRVNHWPDIQKSVYLQPGAYRVKLRAGSESDNVLKVNILGGGVEQTGDYLHNIAADVSVWRDLTTDTFSVNAPGSVTINISGIAGFYLDSIEVDQYSGAAPTPAATLAYTPVPPENQATPMPVPTQFCQAGAGATPAPPDFNATVTPDASGHYQITDTFSDPSLSTQWETTGSGVAVNSGVAGPDGSTGVLQLPYGADTATGLVWVHAVEAPMYVDGWAMADALAVGDEAVAHVYLYNGTNWVEAGSSSFGAGQWYPFHITVTDPGGGPWVALDISVSGPAGARAYLDNLTLYNALSLAPACGFTSVIPGSDTYDSMGVTYPGNKPCPPDNSGMGDVPNNFWGPLFYWMSIQFLSVTGPFPIHVAQGYALAIRAFVDAPFWNYVSVVLMMFDLRPVLVMAGLLVALEIVRMLYSLWRIILKIIPFAG